MKESFIRVVPAYLFPASRMAFSRAQALPGVQLRPWTGHLAKTIERAPSLSPRGRDFSPTHLLQIDESSYNRALTIRIRSEGREIEPNDLHFLDVDGIVRQVFFCLTLLGGVGWKFGGTYSFRRRGSSKPILESFVNREIVDMPWAIRTAVAKRTNRQITSRRIARTALRLDRYYRSGIWSVDRLGVMLGYLWGSLTCAHQELAFSGISMALEALVSTSSVEVTHTLAERCATLLSGPGAAREAIYRTVKDIYGIRSRVVHGRAAPTKGRASRESLFVTAKASHMPATSLAGALRIALDLVEAVLVRPAFLQIVQIERKADRVDEALNSYFLRRLLHGSASAGAQLRKESGLTPDER